MQSISTSLINRNSRLVIVPAAGRGAGKMGTACQGSAPLSVRESTALTAEQVRDGALWVVRFFSFSFLLQ